MVDRHLLLRLGLFGRKKTTRPFKDYYTDWFNTLNNSLLPLLRSSMDDAFLPQLSIHVEMIHSHFQSYYEALDLAASDDVTQLLYPDWRNSLEKPFLWLGDFHPYLFTNLLRSFLDDGDENEDDDDGFGDLGNGEYSESYELFDRPWHLVMAWKNPSKILMNRVEQIECGLRLMVPALVARARDAQMVFIESLAKNWVECDGGNKEAAKAVVAEPMEAQMDEVVSVFLDANRLRRSVISEIIGAANVYQAALFLEGLSQFLVGFKDSELLGEFQRCKTPLSRQTRLAI